MRAEEDYDVEDIDFEDDDNAPDPFAHKTTQVDFDVGFANPRSQYEIEG